MLQRLSINNYAIIDRLEIDPDKGLNILTGETGAGKSIIVGALSLILGERADSGVLIDKEAKCIVEAVFDVSTHTKFIEELVKLDLDDEQQCIIRREINTKGKSRAFINDTPVRLDVLNGLTEMLVDLHQQFDHLTLDDALFQIDVLDAIGGNMQLRQEYIDCYAAYKKVSKRLEELVQQKANWQKEADYKEYLYNELNEAAFKEDEIEEAEQQLKAVNSAETVQQSIQNAVQCLNEGEQPIINELKRIYKQLENVVDALPEAKGLLERLNSAQIELTDIADELSLLDGKFNFSEEEIHILNERVDIGYKLQKKHQVNSTNELLDIAKKLQGELQEGLDIDTDIERLTKERQNEYDKLVSLGSRLSEVRVKQAKVFSTKVNELLRLVGMPNAVFSVGVDTKEEPASYGFDEVQFFLDANKSGKALPIHKAASGGEMSRIMLCIKSLIAEVLRMPTLIFDEVDTGISGEAAKQVGLLLNDLSKHHQIICITHQPQVAARGDYHLYVYKEEDALQRITTKVKVLNSEERVEAIAKMIDGDSPSDVAVQNAKELIAT